MSEKSAALLQAQMEAEESACSRAWRASTTSEPGVRVEGA